MLEHLKKEHIKNEHLSIEINEHSIVYFSCKNCFKIHDVLYKLAKHICESHLQNVENSFELIRKYNPNYAGGDEYNYFKNIFIVSINNISLQWKNIFVEISDFIHHCIRPYL